ncbi:MAG: hypothetical protein ABIN97_15405 [Ginsengibacter sp.]
MKFNLTLLSLFFAFSVTSQTPITAVDTTSSVASYDSTYTGGANTYNWGVSPYNTVLYLDGFSAGGKSYIYSTAITGNVKLRRVNNANISGNYTIEWAEAVTVGANTFNLFPEYQSHLDTFLTNHVYNKGTDNLFDNITTNRNNIERLDWLATSAYSTPTPVSSGFAVFDKGNPGTHDPFCIAAITSVDVAGDPLTYGPIVRVGREDYGDPGPFLTYRVLKATYPSKLLITGASISQNRGGVFISLKDLGVTANTPIYGYSLFSNDLPGTATSADLLDVTNSTFFPLGTGAQGGLDLIAITGLNTDNSVLPVSLTLSKGIILAGQTMIIQGNMFTPNGIVTLNFSGAGGLYSTNITANAQGTFSYTYNIPANAQDGDATVKAYNTITNAYSTQRSFQIQLTSANTPVSHLSIISPQKSALYSAGQQIYFTWGDKLQRRYGGFYYPLAANTGKRLYRYKVEYQIGASGTWKLVNIFNGSGAVGSDISLNQLIQINTPDNSCRIRVTDDYAPANVKTTNTFSVVPVTSNIKAELIWDKSFPVPNISPQGVAADGVARLYFKVSKLNQSGSDIKSVSVSITDDYNHNKASILGKVKPATMLDAYSTEANDASALSSTSNTFVKGGYWFWYVAPEDFSENESTSYANLPERFVTLHVVAQLNNGTTDTKDVSVKIVRPPLMMVHGLASSEKGWENFHYSLNNIDYPFRTSPLFKRAKAVTLNPRSSFQNNAFLLLTPEATAYTGGSNRTNTFQGNIERIRNQGYAANQVDYVCHSMGGSILRTAIAIFKDRYYGRGIYQNYEKGYVHKAITINTPHNSSPVADAITEFVPEFPYSVNQFFSGLFRSARNTPYVFDFIQPEDPGYLVYSKWNSTLAVKDLQVSDAAGGINFPATPVKNHLIAGDVNIYSAETASFFAELDKYMDLLEHCLKIMRNISPTPTLNNILKYTVKGARALAFIEEYSKQKGFPNFLGDGDLVVPLSSQTGGLTQNNLNVTIFTNTFLLNANHSSITDRTDVGNRVKDLLNTTLASPSFADVIPSTPPSASNRAFKTTNDASSKILTSIYDTSKVKIIAPSFNSILFADSTLNIEFKLKDTTGLAYIDVDFQGETITSTSLNSTQTINTQVNPSFIGDQLISVTAVYDRDTVTEYHTDTLTVNVQTNAQLLDFQVEPETKEMQKNEVFYPNYKAVYNTSVAGLPNNAAGITVSVADTSIIKYNSYNNSFTAVTDTGSTFITFNYKGLTDTVFVYLNISDNSNINVICPQSNALFLAGIYDSTKTYQWQVNRGSEYENISDTGIYSGTHTDTLTLSSIPSSYYGYQYSCVISDAFGNITSEPFILKFSDTWTGAIDSAWENPANWSCNIIPDEYMDVIINSGLSNYPVVNSNASCRSMNINPSATIKVNSGFRLDIAGNDVINNY